jgi:drug/metabolite transporter (DMT)-like permease
VDKLFVVLLMIVASAVGAFGGVELKKGSAIFKKKQKLIKIITNEHIIIGFTLYVISAAVVIICLKYNKLSFIYPLTSITYIFTIILAPRLLNEKITNYKLLAVFLIIAGNVLVTIY